MKDERSDDLFDFSREQPPEDVSGIHLRYNREERLKNAPENVRVLHAGKYTEKKGLIKSLFATKASSMLALAIFMLVLFLFFYGKKHSATQFEDFRLVLDCQCETTADAATGGTMIFAALTVEPKTQNYSGETISCVFFVLTENDAVLQEARVESVYLGEKLILNAAIPLTPDAANVKAVKAQAEIAGKFFVLKKYVE